MMQVRRDSRFRITDGSVSGGADAINTRSRAWVLRARNPGAMVLVVVAAAMPLVLSGCAPTKAGRRLGLSPASRPLQRDLPLPAGFALVDESTEDWISGPVRFIRHCYKGRADKQEVRLFYRQQMPLARWTPVVERTYDGRCTMSFSRKRERCTIEIVSRKTLLGPATRVTVSVAPAMAAGANTSGSGGKTRQR